MKVQYKKEDVEFLIATMHKSSLDFLVPMFCFTHFSELSILIINQTTADNILESTYPNVRVINSYEFGLSKSRNLALDNAKGKFSLLTDDDVIYQINPIPVILQSFLNHHQAAVIAFLATNLKGKLLKKYPKKLKTNLNILDIYNIMSIEMVLNNENIKSKNIRFDENFGLGTSFPLGEEVLFLNDLKKQQQIVFVPEIIVAHSEITTNESLDFKRRYFALGAIYQKIHTKSFYLWVAIKLFFDLKQKIISLSEIIPAIHFAKKGRLQFKKLSNEY